MQEALPPRHIARSAIWAAAAMLAALGLSACAASPPVPPAVVTPGWDDSGKAAIRQAFEDTMYGPWPGTLDITVDGRNVVATRWRAARGQLERLDLSVGTGRGRKRIFAGLALPPDANADEPVPYVVFMTGWPDCQAFSEPALAVNGPCERVSSSWARDLAGIHKRAFPVADYLAAGLAVATLDVRQVVADDVALAPTEWQALTDGEGSPNSGAVVIWAAALAGLTEALDADPRLNAHRTAIAGFSRHGKSVLIAAAFSDGADLVFAHQSGFGGAALSRSDSGEGLARMVAPNGHPHWFSPALSRYAGHPETLPVDQDELLALIAPRPLLLGNGRRDTWSNPAATFEAARRASPAWTSKGVIGLDQSSMQDYDPAAGIAFYFRGGGHGFQPDDHAAFLAFLKAHGFTAG